MSRIHQNTHYGKNEYLTLTTICMLINKIFYKTSRIIFHHLLGENDIVDFFVMTRIDKLTGEFGQVESVHLRYLCAYEKLNRNKTTCYKHDFYVSWCYCSPPDKLKNIPDYVWWESNLRPLECKPNAMPTELCGQVWSTWQSTGAGLRTTPQRIC